MGLWLTTEDGRIYSTELEPAQKAPSLDTLLVDWVRAHVQLDPKLESELHVSPVKEECIRVDVREKSPIGLVLNVWTRDLQQEASVYRFAETMVESLSQQQIQTEEATAECASLEEKIGQWKETAKKLEDGWSSEKDTVLQNFLVLYNEKHDSLEALKSQNSQLKYEIEELKREKESGDRRRRVKVDPELENQPDDQDHVVYDEAMVARYAAGIPNTHASSGRKRKNRTTGAIEYDGVDAVVEDTALFPQAAQKKAKAKVAPRKKGEAKAVAKKPVTKRDGPEQATVEGSSQDDYEPVDLEARNNILARLASLREQEDDSSTDDEL